MLLAGEPLPATMCRIHSRPHGPAVSPPPLHAMRPSCIAAFSALVLIGCVDRGEHPSPEQETTLRVAVDTIGDTISVRTENGSVRGNARLVEDLRIGKTDGADEFIFGQVGAIAVLSNGELLVYDEQAVTLRRFGPDGSYRGVVSREGAGPGEYQNVPGMAVLADDRIVVHDYGNHRFNVYAADGTLLTTLQQSSNVAEWRPVHTHASGIYVFDELSSAGSTESRPSLIRLDESGVAVDTIAIPLATREIPGLQIRSATRSFGVRIPFYPAAHWTVTPKGNIVVVDGGRYRIDVHSADGSVLRMSRTANSVTVSEQERAVEEERITARFRRLEPTWSWDGPRIPATKPPITWLHAAQDGAIWVRVAQPGSAIAASERAASARSHVKEPIIFDVFEADGRFRGQVAAPEGMQLAPYPVLGSDMVWAVAKDVDGVNYVVRFRIVAD